MIYFDNSATTPIDSEVLDTYVKISKNFWGNPSSLNQMGSDASQVLQISRNQLKNNLGVTNCEVFFSSGGSEGNNDVIKGVALARKISGRHIIVSTIEHESVLKAAEQLEKLGFDVTYLSPNRNGIIEASKLVKEIRSDTILVSIMAVNNETGAIQPLNEIALELEKHPQIVYHVDSVQAVGKNLENLYLNSRIDFATFSAHKFHGPRGVGFVLYNPNRHIIPLISGGGQEKGLRSGTENVAGIAAMVKALRLETEKSTLNVSKYQKMKAILLAYLNQDPDFEVISKENKLYTPSIISFAVKGIKGETAVHYLERQDVFVSTTSACSSQSSQPSHVLTAMGLSDEVLKGALRVSLGSQNTVEEMHTFIKTIKKMKEDIKVING